MFTQVSFFKLKTWIGMWCAFSFLLSIASPKETGILGSSSWNVTNGTVIEMSHHADTMSLLCTCSILCIRLLQHYHIIPVSLLWDWKFLQKTPCYIFLNEHMQCRLSKYSAEPGIVLGGKKLMWVGESDLYVYLIKYCFRAELLSTRCIYTWIFKCI